MENINQNSRESVRAVKAKANANYPELNDIRDDIKHLKDDATKLARHAKDDTREALSNATRSTFERLERHVHERPVQTLGYAFLGGVIASLLLRRG